MEKRALRIVIEFGMRRINCPETEDSCMRHLLQCPEKDNRLMSVLLLFCLAGALLCRRYGQGSEAVYCGTSWRGMPTPRNLSLFDFLSVL